LELFEIIRELFGIIWHSAPHIIAPRIAPQIVPCIDTVPYYLDLFGKKLEKKEEENVDCT
jgi:hypothetical protein